MNYDFWDLKDDYDDRALIIVRLVGWIAEGLTHTIDSSIHRTVDLTHNLTYYYSEDNAAA